MYRSSFCAAVVLAGLMLVTLGDAQAQGLKRFYGEAATVFSDPQAGVDALKAGLAADNVDDLARLLGLNAAEIRKTEDFDTRLKTLEKAATEGVYVKEDGDDRRIVSLGNLVWPFPFPLVKTKDGWAFDTKSGLEEVVARRIGENELTAIDEVRGYVTAQQQYAQEDRDGDDVLEYAQKLISTKGSKDGLYWEADGGEESPAGPFVNETKVKQGPSDNGYFGYRFRILKGQGNRIAGGAYGYVINGNMIAGYALIAWPARYGESGIKTFVVNQRGTVYERDLGWNTSAVVKKLFIFNPGKAWDIVPD